MSAYHPFVTIFVLVYNNADGLCSTIQSVLHQTYENAEVIISDDGSSNYDTGILENYARKLRTKYKKVRVNVNEKNVGTVKHLNRVIAMAEGELLFNCCSGDTFYEETTISQLVEQFANPECKIITARRMDEYADGHTKIRPVPVLGRMLQHCPHLLINYMIQKKNLLSGSCTFARKSLYEEYGVYDEEYHLVEDYPYYLMLLLEGVDFGWYGKPAIRHTIGGVSTGKVHPSIYSDITRMREKLYQSKDNYRNIFSAKTMRALEAWHKEYEGSRES
ncbi:MAG: glycosyltransferase [Lachnospiraceae bacterium]